MATDGSRQSKTPSFGQIRTNIGGQNFSVRPETVRDSETAGKGRLCTSHIAPNLKKVAMCSTSHGAGKIAIFSAAGLQFRGRPACRWALKKESFSCVYSWDVGRFQMAGRCSEQPISIPSESSAYPEFKTFHWHPPDHRLASKKIT